MNINQLDQVNGEGTTLVTLLLPADYKLRNALQLVRNERSEAQNIKDKNTRKKVQAALKKAENELKNLGEIPENGAAIYTKNDKSVTYIPEKKLNEKLYRCDNKFHVEPVKKLEENRSKYGIITADRDKYRVGTADIHGNITRLHTGSSGIPSKHSKGGQSAQRWERYRTEQKKNYITQLTNTVQKEMLEKLRKNQLLGLIIGGTLNKEIKKQLNQELTNKIVAETRIRQNLDKTYHDVKHKLQSRQSIELEKFQQKFLNRLDQQPNKVAYSKQEIREAAKLGAVEQMAVPENQYV